MRLVYVFAVAVGLAVAANATIARGAAPPPKPNFTGFAFLTGSWSCANNDPRGRLAYRFTWAPDESGYWFVGKRTVPAAFGQPAASDVNMITYDFDAKHFVELQTGRFGQYDYSTTAGLVAGKIVLHSVPFARLPGTPGVTDLTVTRRGSSHLSLSGGATVNGARTTLWSGSCTKNG